MTRIITKCPKCGLISYIDRHLHSKQCICMICDELYSIEPNTMTKLKYFFELTGAET